MKFKRFLFVSILFVLFLSCFQVMNKRYDELSRYQYANNDNRDLILKYMTTEEVNYLIDRQYKPEEFLNYFGIEGFTIYKLDWYNYAKNIEKLDIENIVEITNQLSDKMTFVEFMKYCNYFSIEQLYDFYFKENLYVEGLSLISDMSVVTNEIDKNKTLYTYEPKDLVVAEHIPVINREKVYIRENVNDAISNVCKAAFDINQKTCGNLVLIEGYVSYENQIELYKNGIVKYGIDDVLKYVSYPGQSIQQLGDVIVLISSGLENTSDIENEEEIINLQQIWLREHCKEYGFEFINDSETNLDKFILKFVGIKEKSE